MPMRIISHLTKGQSIINHDSSGSGQLTGSAGTLAAVVLSAWANGMQTGEGSLAPKTDVVVVASKAGPAAVTDGAGFTPS